VAAVGWPILWSTHTTCNVLDDQNASQAAGAAAALAIDFIFSACAHLRSDIRWLESRAIFAVSLFPVPTAIGNGYCDHINNKEECGELLDKNVGQGAAFLNSHVGRNTCTKQARNTSSSSCVGGPQLHDGVAGNWMKMSEARNVGALRRRREGERGRLPSRRMKPGMTRLKRGVAFSCFSWQVVTSLIIYGHVPSHPDGISLCRFVGNIQHWFKSVAIR